MRKRKLIKIIIGCIGFVVVLGISGLFTADYAVNRVMDSFAAGLEAEMESDNNQVESKEQPLSIPSESVDAKQEKGNDNPSKLTGTATNNSARKPTGTVTKEKVKKVKENLTVSDKATVASVILKNLSLSDLKKLRFIAKGGLTVEEKREAKQMLLTKLSPGDYNKLSALAKKYGISKGRTYDEAIQEYNP
ncbi:hypothetical protein [Cohnella silvisoli]|uniref:Uncharacterized protein n=1 Tax=Cohnella silvisoli TaxID=2873699 RepID=A0ABV1KX86_9BACL|nr:hypothetical protein [Cohnella silvisoli]MCD9024072.1 hypothetical protein [Cohnella silvisoli]